MNKTHFAIRRGSPFSRASAALMLCSAAVRLFWFFSTHGVSADAYTTAVHFATPTLCCVLLAVCIRRESLKLSLVPVAFGCLFFILKALSFPSQVHTVLCCALYALVFVLYGATALGFLPTRAPLVLVFALPFLYHVFVEDLRKLLSPAPPSFTEWLPEISVLLIMAGLAALAWGMEKKTES